MTRVVIYVEGGVVTTAFAEHDDLIVEVIDADDLKVEGKNPQKALRSATRGMTEVY